MAVDVLSVTAGVLIAVGAAGCVMGRKQLRNYLGLIGLLSGAIVGAGLGLRAYGPMGALPGAFFGAMVGATLRTLGPVASLFVSGAVAGAILAILLSIGVPAWRNPALMVLPLTSGILAVLVPDWSGLVTTSLQGAAAATWGAAIVLGWPTSPGDLGFVHTHPAAVLAMVVLFLGAGITWQVWEQHRKELATIRYFTG